MGESIFVRVRRVLAAQAEATVDAMERASGASLLREAVRQVQQAADEIRAEQSANRVRREEAERRQRQLRERLGELEEQARFAIGRGRDDLAEAAVARQLELEAEVRRLKGVQSGAAAEAKRLDECLAEVEARTAHMRKELAAFEARRSGGANGAAPEGRRRRRVARAEAAFERVMASAGADAVLGDPAEAAKLAEVEAMQKEAAVAERLSALRAARPANGRGAGKAR